MKKVKRIQDIFDQLSIFLKTIEIDDDTLKPKIVILFPFNWEITNNPDFIYTILDIREDISKVYLFNITNLELGIDELASHLINIVNHNLKIEKEKERIQIKIQKEKEKFEDKINKIKGDYINNVDWSNHKFTNINQSNYIIGCDLALNNNSDYSVFHQKNIPATDNPKLTIYKVHEKNINIKEFDKPDQINVNATWNQEEDLNNIDEDNIKELPIIMSQPIELNLPKDVQNNIKFGLEEMRRELLQQQMEEQEDENQDNNSFE